MQKLETQGVATDDLWEEAIEASLSFANEAASTVTVSEPLSADTRKFLSNFRDLSANQLVAMLRRICRQFLFRLRRTPGNRTWPRPSLSTRSNSGCPGIQLPLP